MAASLTLRKTSTQPNPRNSASYSLLAKAQTLVYALPGQLLSNYCASGEGGGSARYKGLGNVRETLTRVPIPEAVCGALQRVSHVPDTTCHRRRLQGQAPPHHLVVPAHGNEAAAGNEWPLLRRLRAR